MKHPYYLSTSFFLVLVAFLLAGSGAYAANATLLRGKASPAAVVLATPAGVQARPSLAGAITVEWNAVSGASQYIIEYSLSENSGFQPLATVNAEASKTIYAYQDKGLGDSETFFYRVKAVAGAGESGYSAPAKATTHAAGYKYKIMPLGDSNTHGTKSGDTRPISQRVAYRDHLYDLLVNGKISFDFVGSEQSGSDLVPDPDNAGFSGSRVMDILSLLQNSSYQNQAGETVSRGSGPYLDKFNPDVILLHIGTNGGRYGVSDDDQNIAQVGQLLDEVDKYEERADKEVTVVLALIINRIPQSDTDRAPEITTSFNKKVEALANKRIQEQSDRLVVVDMENDANIIYKHAEDGGDIEDFLHLTPGGYEKMANKWFDVLKPLLTPASTDTHAPETTITLQPDQLTNSSSAKFEFSSNESKVYFELSLDGGAFASTSNPVTLANLADGQHTVKVRAVDASGNADATPAAYTWTVDTQAPPAPSFTAVTEDRGADTSDRITSDNTLKLSGKAEANAEISISEKSRGVLGKTTASGTGDWVFSYESTALPQGVYSFTATATDAAKNTGSASAAFQVTLDLTAPGSTISTKAASPVKDAFEVQVVFSEPIYGLSLADFTVTNGSLSNLSSEDKQHYTATVTPAAGGEGKVGISLAAGKATDVAGNGNTASNKLEVSYDFKRPELTLTSGAAASVNSAFTVTFTFTESVSGFGVDDISVQNGTAGVFEAKSAAVYTAQVTPAGAGQVKVSVAADKAFDAAQNGNLASGTLTRTYDAEPPTVALSTSAASPTNKAFAVDITFSEEVKGFTADDISVSNGSVTNLSASNGTTYTATVSPAADGEVAVFVKAGVATDVAGNENKASATLRHQYDATAPAVVLSTAAKAPVKAAFELLIKFSEAVSGLAEADFAVTNGTLSNLSSSDASTYSATVTPTPDGEGELIVYLPASKAQDAAGNGNTASNQLKVRYDFKRPEVVLASTAPTVTNSPFVVTFTFSEAVSGFESADVSVTNASVSEFSQANSSTYTARIVPAADGEVQVNVNANKAFDAADNGNLASAALKRTFDAQAPTVALSSGAPAVVNKPFTVTLTFSEPVDGLTIAGVQVQNGSASTLKKESDKTYTLLVSPVKDGEVSVVVKAAAATDAAGNGNTASAALQRQYDATSPTVAISTAATSPVNAPFVVTIAFSEAVAGFDLADISLTNASADNFKKVSDSQYTARIRPGADGTVSINIASAVAQDVATNSNSASNTLRLQYDATAPAGYAVAFTTELVDIQNQNHITVKVTGAEVGATYFYSVSSSNGGESVSGSATAGASSFEISNLNVQGLADGQLTVAFYQVDAATNRGADATAQVKKNTKNVVAVASLKQVDVLFKTAFENVPLPKQVEVTFSNGEKENLQVNWQQGNYKADVPGVYQLQGELVLPPNAFNTSNHMAAIAVKVAPNQAPTALAFSATSFKPDAGPADIIGTLTTTDSDDDTHTYTLVSGAGDTQNDLFEIVGNQLHLRSNRGLTGIESFSIRVRSTDPYNNSIEKAFVLKKEVYKPETKLKFVNAFSPDGDGINDTWVVPELRFYNHVDVRVFSREGVQLFHTTNPEEGWDGRGQNGEVKQGSYFYIIEVKDINLVQKGVLTVLK